MHPPAKDAACKHTQNEVPIRRVRIDDDHTLLLRRRREHDAPTEKRKYPRREIGAESHTDVYRPDPETGRVTRDAEPLTRSATRVARSRLASRVACLAFCDINKSPPD